MSAKRLGEEETPCIPQTQNRQDSANQVVCTQLRSRRLDLAVPIPPGEVFSLCCAFSFAHLLTLALMGSCLAVGLLPQPVGPEGHVFRERGKPPHFADFIGNSGLRPARCPPGDVL